MEEARKTLRDSIVNDMTVEKLIQMTEMGLIGKIKTTTASTYNEQVFGQIAYLKAESSEESDAIRYECVSADGYVAASTIIDIDEIVGIHGAVNEGYPEDFLDILLLMADESVVTISVKY